MAAPAPFLPLLASGAYADVDLVFLHPLLVAGGAGGETAATPVACHRAVLAALGAGALRTAADPDGGGADPKRDDDGAPRPQRIVPLTYPTHPAAPRACLKWTYAFPLAADALLAAVGVPDMDDALLLSSLTTAVELDLRDLAEALAETLRGRVGGAAGKWLAAPAGPEKDNLTSKLEVLISVGDEVGMGDLVREFAGEAKGFDAAWKEARAAVQDAAVAHVAAGSDDSAEEAKQDLTILGTIPATDEGIDEPGSADQPASADVSSSRPASPSVAPSGQLSVPASPTDGLASTAASWKPQDDSGLQRPGTAEATSPPVTPSASQPASTSVSPIRASIVRKATELRSGNLSRKGTLSSRATFTQPDTPADPQSLDELEAFLDAQSPGIGLRALLRYLAAHPDVPEEAREAMWARVDWSRLPEGEWEEMLTPSPMADGADGGWEEDKAAGGSPHEALPHEVAVRSVLERAKGLAGAAEPPAAGDDGESEAAGEVDWTPLGFASPASAGATPDPAAKLVGRPTVSRLPLELVGVVVGVPSGVPSPTAEIGEDDLGLGIAATEGGAEVVDGDDGEPQPDLPAEPAEPAQPEASKPPLHPLPPPNVTHFDEPEEESASGASLDRAFSFERKGNEEETIYASPPQRPSSYAGQTAPYPMAAAPPRKASLADRNKSSAETLVGGQKGPGMGAAFVKGRGDG